MLPLLIRTWALKLCLVKEQVILLHGAQAWLNKVLHYILASVKQAGYTAPEETDLISHLADHSGSFPKHSGWKTDIVVSLEAV